MNRKNGTSTASPAALTGASAIVTYRELAPSLELSGLVRAYFSFIRGGPAWHGSRPVIREVQLSAEDSFCSPVFADGQTSLVVDLGATCTQGVGWLSGTPVEARAIGALRTVGGPAGEARSEMIGVYFEPGSTSTFLEACAVELTDRVVNLEQLWGSKCAGLAEDLAELGEAARVDRLEAALIERARRAPELRPNLDVVGLARWVRQEPALMTVGRMAEAAGVSRQHLTRLFRERIGVTPKRYCRVARFQRGLVYAGAGNGVQWAQVAADLGYADQSHMIAEFRELSGLTPEVLAARRWFHPFILEARSRAPQPWSCFERQHSPNERSGPADGADWRR